MYTSILELYHHKKSYKIIVHLKIVSDYNLKIFIIMIYQIQMQFIPGNDQIWVARLNPNDPVYEYDNFADAQAQATILQDNDPTGRQYRVIQLSAE